MQLCESRLKNIAIQDRSEISLKIKKLLKAEILYVLRNYFDVTGDSLDVEVSIDNVGKYDISITAKANIVRLVRLFSD